MIQRILEAQITEKLGSGKALLLFGARQLGKTTLLKKIFAQRPDALWLNGDEPEVQALFAGVNSSRLAQIFAGKKYVVLDEAQRIPDIGLKLKLATDNIPGTQVIATGSSAFELANKTNEPLTGRKWEYHMFPVSWGEMVAHHGLLEEQKMLHTRKGFPIKTQERKEPSKFEVLNLKFYDDSFPAGPKDDLL